MTEGKLDISNQSTSALSGLLDKLLAEKGIGAASVSVDASSLIRLILSQKSPNGQLDMKFTFPDGFGITSLMAPNDCLRLIATELQKMTDAIFSILPSMD